MTKPIQNLLNGFKAFKQQYFVSHTALFGQLKKGQKPYSLVIACSDSRVDPAILLQAEPGDLFVIRNVANLVPPYEQAEGFHGTSAALEFAVNTLEVEHIIILGHSQCGGILSLFYACPITSQQSFIGKWMQLAIPAYQHVKQHFGHMNPEQQSTQCSQLALTNSLENLKSFDWITERVEKNQLNLHAWYFDIDSGNLLTYDTMHKAFKELE